MKPNSQVTLGEFFRQCVGIDISKNKFTVCLYMYDRASDVGCCTKSIDFDNTKSGFNQMVKWSRKEAVKDYPLTYLMEPTGVYYERLAYHLYKIGQTIYVVLPNKARKFCESEGIKTKTDAMDARCLALMGCASRKLKPWSPPAAIYRELRQMTRFHADLCVIRRSVANRMEALDHMESVSKTVRKHCEKLIKEIDTLTEKNDKDIIRKVAEDVKAGLISTRRIIFTPSVDLKDELASTAIQITCIDRNGKEVKRVTSTSGEVEDPENGNSYEVPDNPNPPTGGEAPGEGD